VLFLAPTGRIGLTLRSRFVLEPNTYGLVGGAVDTGEKLQKAVSREAREELGVLIDPTKLKLLYTYEELGFRYTTFLYPTRNEFQPKLNWESLAFVWFGLDDLPENLHPGVAGMLAEEPVRFKLRACIPVRPECGSPVRFLLPEAGSATGRQT
jgi:8-oxo-dGTP diphosphatase